MDDEHASVRTFLIADVRGYSRYTEEYGDEAAAKLAAKFAELAAEGVEAHGGELIELRGDEALVVFSSARQAIRAAVDLQAEFGAVTEECDLPLRVGIGIDSGEAVRLDDGSFRGAALNIAARLCGRAHGGEVLLSAATARLAGTLGGLQYSDRGKVRLKNIPEPIHIFQAYSELDARPANRWVLMFFGRPGRTLGWRLGALVVLVAAVTAGTVVYLTGGDNPGESGAATNPTTTAPISSPSTPSAATAGLDRLVPPEIWKDCRLQTVPQVDALQTAVCLPAGGVPDRWEISSYADGAAVRAAYESQLALHAAIRRDQGKCDAFSWGGEKAWLHGPDKPGGRLFCYFDGDDAVIVWTHERLGQATHRDVLVTAREGGSAHDTLTRWWKPWHHRIGRAE